MSEAALGVLRMIKLFAWETYAKKQIYDLRETELKQIRLGQLLNVIMSKINSTLPLIAEFTVFSIYVSFRWRLSGCSDLLLTSFSSIDIASERRAYRYVSSLYEKSLYCSRVLDL